MSTRNRIQTIFSTVVTRYKEGVVREQILASITQEFEIAKPITAVTYFNDALRAAGLSTRKPYGPRKPKAVPLPPPTEGASVTVADLNLQELQPVVQEAAPEVVQESAAASVEEGPAADPFAEVVRELTLGTKVVTRARNQYYWAGYDAYQPATEMASGYDADSIQHQTFSTGWAAARKDRRTAAE